MNTLKIMLTIGGIYLAFAVVVDGFCGGQGLGTIIGSLTLFVVSLICALTAKSRRSAPPVVRTPTQPASKTPVFAHVPGPGEPGYDPDYDPDQDKYWRRYY